MSPFSSKRCAALLAALLVAVGLTVAAAGCGGGSDSASGKEGATDGSEVVTGGTGHPGVDLANTRSVAGPIDRDTVAELKPIWETPVKGLSTYGSQAAPAIIVDGVVYSQDLASNVQAIDLESGEVLWEKKYESPSHGPNGLAVAEGKVFGATASAGFALDQATGKQLWTVELAKQPSREGIDMAPGYWDGKVYLSTVPTTAESTYFGGGVGTLYALDGKTGKEIWHFDTVPKDLWGDKKQNAGGGLWYQPSFDDKGYMYFGTANPVPIPGTAKDPWGESRPGPNLYTDSVLKLDAETGKLQWFYQATPHDIYDWDFQNPPVLATAGGREVAIGSGKSGFVVALDTKTGKPVWKTPVGRHNGHDEDGLKAMRGEYSKIKTGEVFPGLIGGVIAPLASDGNTVYVPVVNHSLTLVSGSEFTESSPATGEVVALDIATGKVRWTAQAASPVYGAPTVVNDVVFITTAEGEVHALDSGSGGEVWNAALPAGTNVGVMVSGDTVIAPAGLPIAEGQKPAIVAYSLKGGQ